jgi:Zn-dependent peptidase ImmA (M78 family)
MSREVNSGIIRARAVLEELRVKHPSELLIEAIAWRYGVRVYTSPLDGAEGCMIRKGHRGTILIREGLDPGKYRFNVAHELGHFLLHPMLSLKACTETDFLFWRIRHDNEREADDFAVNLLLPEAMFVKRIEGGRPSFDTISQVAAEFETSLTFTAIRYVELSGFPCALVVSSGDSVEWFKISEGFPGWFEKGQRIDPDSHAYDALHGKAMPTGIQPVQATAWFPQRQWRDIIIREHSIRLGTYEKVLSLIWIPD